jgi:predicted nucleic acid-binding protein
MPEETTYILDSYALISFLADEPGAGRVAELFTRAGGGNIILALSVMNLGELLYISERRGGLKRAQETLVLVRQLPIEIQPADEEAVFAAAHIMAHRALSYADAFVVALALKTGGIILTGDPEFHTASNLVNIDWLR